MTSFSSAGGCFALLCFAAALFGLQLVASAAVIGGGYGLFAFHAGPMLPVKRILYRLHGSLNG